MRLCWPWRGLDMHILQRTAGKLSQRLCLQWPMCSLRSVCQLVLSAAAPQAAMAARARVSHLVSQTCQGTQHTNYRQGGCQRPMRCPAGVRGLCQPSLSCQAVQPCQRHAGMSRCSVHPKACKHMPPVLCRFPPSPPVSSASSSVSMSPSLCLGARLAALAMASSSACRSRTISRVSACSGGCAADALPGQPSRCCLTHQASREFLHAFPGSCSIQCCSPRCVLHNPRSTLCGHCSLGPLPANISSRLSLADTVLPTLTKATAG